MSRKNYIKMQMNELEDEIRLLCDKRYNLNFFKFENLKEYQFLNNEIHHVRGLITKMQELDENNMKYFRLLHQTKFKRSLFDVHYAYFKRLARLYETNHIIVC
jgi:hypothetical protein